MPLNIIKDSSSHPAQPFNLANHPVNDTVRLVSLLLDSIVNVNDPLESHCSNTSSQLKITRFHSKAVPPITVHAYLERMLRFVPFSNDVLLPILVYFDRIASAKTRQNGGIPSFAISSLNIHRLLIAGLVVSAKFNSDIFYNNARYAKVGGLTTEELNRLEMEFLYICGFQLFVSVDELQTYANSLLEHASKKETLNMTSNSKDFLKSSSTKSSSSKNIPHKQPTKPRLSDVTHSKSRLHYVDTTNPLKSRLPYSSSTSSKSTSCIQEWTTTHCFQPPIGYAYGGM